MKYEKNIAAIIPVGGLSSRMESFKPLLPMGRNTILETTIDLFKQNGIHDVFVVTGHRSQDLEALILKKKHHAFFLLPADIQAIRAHTIKDLDVIFRLDLSQSSFPALNGSKYSSVHLL